MRSGLLSRVDYPPKETTVKRALYTALVCLVVTTVACGDNNGNGDPIPTNNDDQDMGGPGEDAGADMAVPGEDLGTDAADGGEDAGSADSDMGVAPDMDEDPCALVDCDPGEMCDEGVCKIADACTAAIDLGTLAFGPPTSFEGSLILDGFDTVAATCGEPDMPERVVTFTLSADALIEYDVTWLGQFDGVVELRSDCPDAASVEACSDIESGQAVLEAGTYFLVLEQRFGNAGSFEGTITATEAACQPGVDACVGDDLQRCPMPDMPTTLECAGGCANATCIGDSCADPIVVTASGTFAGDGRAYTSAFNFESNAECRTADAAPIPTPGYDLVFSLPGLEAGNIVSIDAMTNDANINAIFITSQCGDTAACEATYKVEAADWVVTADGDYFVIVDKRQAAPTPFEFSIGVTP